MSDPLYFDGQRRDDGSYSGAAWAPANSRACVTVLVPDTYVASPPWEALVIGSVKEHDVSTERVPVTRSDASAWMAGTPPPRLQGAMVRARCWALAMEAWSRRGASIALAR